MHSILVLSNLLFLFLLSLASHIQAKPFPIGFSIPECKIVQQIPEKDRDFAYIVPGDLNTYIYNFEAEYYTDYQRSYYAITREKAGWDCMRHYEILANGCIPYFLDIDKCNPNTMTFLPKELIKEAMNLDGVSYGKIDHTKFNYVKYHELLNKLLDHTRKYLTTRAMSQYILDTINYSGNGKILYLSNDASPDYLRCCILIGLKELLQDRIIDFPKIEHIYKNYTGNILRFYLSNLYGKRLYGKGMSYTKIIDDIPIDRSNIEQRIKNKEFDLIIYGSVHRGLRFYDLVCQIYEAEKIVYLCGEDSRSCDHLHLHNLFLREFDAYKEE